MKPLDGIRDVRGRQLSGMLARDAFERGLDREVTSVLEGAFREIVNDLLVTNPGPADRARLMALFGRVNGYLEQAYTKVSRATLTAMTQYGAIEAEAAKAELLNLVQDLGGDVGGIVADAGSLLTPTMLQSIAVLPIEGLHLGDWWEAQSNAMTLATRRAIQIGMVKGEGPRELAARLIPPRAGTAPAVWRQARSQARTLVRTTITAVHEQAALASYEQVGDTVTGEYELLSARDNRVSKICAALDGRRFRYDDPARKVPPFHMNCRTTTVPVINAAVLGLKDPGKLASNAIPSYDRWLRRQPAATQAEVLGATRARAYREGRLTLPQLIDDDTRVLTLAELRDVLGTPADVVDLARAAPAS
jgi:SPP1 gp7 family putative phage head morphogenesis protein